MQSSRITFHIDVNSAYLSWEAANRLQFGSSLDLRTIPSVIGGDVTSRHGIILAKSIPAKKYNIITGESLYLALQKCPHLFVAAPRYDLYIQCSNAMREILEKYSPALQRYSIDEYFLDYTAMQSHFGSPETAAFKIKEEIKNTLGFTVNIGISTNKLLAKMASDFEKPDKIHTLYPKEISNKMWPLPVEDLLMVGRATAKKLHHLNIYTIGQLAQADPKLLYIKFKSHGLLIWRFANGIEQSPIRTHPDIQKGIGNSTTLSFDVEDKRSAHQILLSLTETVAMRVRDAGVLTQLISVSIKNHHFISYSHQQKLSFPTDSTNLIYTTVTKLFDEIWRGEPVRHLGVHVSALHSQHSVQLSLLDPKDSIKQKKLDSAIDQIRIKYGNCSIVRASFLHTGLKPLTGGVIEEAYPMMSSFL